MSEANAEQIRKAHAVCPLTGVQSFGKRLFVRSV